MNQTKQKQLLRVLGNTKGRFFGLQTKQGENINAQLQAVTPFYVSVVDNNTGAVRKFAKNSISKLAVGGLRYSA